jgi:hypothetical protein
VSLLPASAGPLLSPVAVCALGWVQLFGSQKVRGKSFDQALCSENTTAQRSGMVASPLLFPEETEEGWWQESQV